MFAELHSYINSLKSVLLHFTGQPYCKKSRSAKVKDGIINLILMNYLYILTLSKKDTRHNDTWKSIKCHSAECLSKNAKKVAQMS
jgi:hypothetical protein